MLEAKARYLDASMADKKGGKFTTAVRYWVTFCTHVLGVSCIQPYDATRDVKLLYESFLEDCAIWIGDYNPGGSKSGASANTVEKYISTIRGWHRRYYGELGLGAAASRIKQILKGVRRLVPQPPPKERHGLCPRDLRTGMDRLYPVASFERDLWDAVLQVTLAALARGCEVALEGKEAFEEDQHITPEDVSWFWQAGVLCARILWRKRKDLKVLRGKHSVVILSGGGSIFDPVLALHTWMGRRSALGLASNGPLFCHANGTSITVAQVRDKVKEVAAAAGRDPTLYGAHSLRIGGATAALAAGVAPSLIRLLGRWSSDIYEIYTRMSLQAALQVGRALTSTEVHTFEGGFHKEHLELLPAEVQFLRGDGNTDHEEEEEL